MKVVFLEEVEGTARTGDVKNVADGFARNYLLPRKLAAPANDHYINIAQARATKEARKQERLDEDARNLLLPKVDGISIRTEVRVGEQGKLFGSVTARDVAELVTEATKIELEHKQIDLREPIRELGVREVNVKLTRNVIAKVTLSVEPIGGMPEPEAAAEEAAVVEAVAESDAGEAAEEAAAEEVAAEVEAEVEAEEAVEEDTAGEANDDESEQENE
jgi:large subunit ribosomal protein L9